MEFSIEFYCSVTGRCPVREFLDRLKATDPDDFAAVLAGLAKLRNRQYHRMPLYRPIGDELFELRHIGVLNTRVFYFFMPGRKIVIVHGIRNKGWSIPAGIRKVSIDRMKDWLARME